MMWAGGAVGMREPLLREPHIPSPEERISHPSVTPAASVLTVRLHLTSYADEAHIVMLDHLRHGDHGGAVG
eukprot:401003-Pelagomonas_calceolata.AAC.3